ncbi:MAG: DUF3801 domain-containing protein [Acetivibrio sp.]
MSDMEGMQESVQIAIKLAEILEHMFGFAWHVGTKPFGVLGQGAGKACRYIWNEYKTNKMVEGGEKKFERIVKNKGSLDMSITTIHIEDWSSKEGKELQTYLTNRGIQYVLLDDMTKGDNRVQMMFHATDANRVNSLLSDYKKVGFDHAKSAAEAYDDLSEPEKETFDEAFRTAEAKAEEVVYRKMPSQEVTRCKEQVKPITQKQAETKKKEGQVIQVAIPSVQVAMDEERGVAYVRCGGEGYLLDIKEVTKKDRYVVCNLRTDKTYASYQNKKIAYYVNGTQLHEKLVNANQRGGFQRDQGLGKTRTTTPSRKTKELPNPSLKQSKASFKK